LTDNRLQVIDTDIFFAYRKYKPKDVPPIYLDKSSITATSSIQRQYPGNQISKQQKVVSPEKPISPTSNLNSIQQPRPKRDSQYASSGAKGQDDSPYKRKVYNTNTVASDP